MLQNYTIYIDESGDEGFAFSKGSKEWFVIAGVIVNEAKTNIIKVVDDIRQVLDKPPKSPLHFKDLKHEQKIPYLQCLVKHPIKLIGVLVHKPSLNEPEKFQQRYRLYYYSTRYLLERISWYCRDHQSQVQTDQGIANLVFSNRSGMSYEEMRNYFELLKKNTDIWNVQIDWRYIRPKQIKAFSPMKRVGLMVADAIAHSLWRAVEEDRFGNIEDRYIKTIRNLLYRRKGTTIGYGIKFWPREVVKIIEQSEKHLWVRELNKKAGPGP